MPSVRKLSIASRLSIAPAILAASVVLGSSGCGGPRAVHHATIGDFPALDRELDARAARGDLDEAEIRAVARAILEHDLGRLAPPEGVRRVFALEACASSIEGPLEKLAKGDDDVAGAAAVVLVSAGLGSVDRFTDRHRDDRRPLFRAAATRGLIDASEAPLRAERALDDDERVRRAAVSAAGEAGCASDFPLLLDAARRDPSAIVRVDAVRGLAAIAPRLSTASARADLVDRLSDLWSGGDDALRGAVARAWASAPLLEVGGRRSLEAAIGREEGHASVEAAAALLGARGDGAFVLARLARDEDLAVRVHALRLLDPAIAEHLTLLRATLEEREDPALRVVAAESLLRPVPSSRGGAAADRDRAHETLLSLLARADRIGTDAAIALAGVGDARAKPRLVGDLAVPSWLRFRAASALVRLGAAAEVRKLLASADLDVRDPAACAVLSTPRAR
jgi:HEAT repeat protein